MDLKSGDAKVIISREQTVGSRALSECVLLTRV